MIFTCATFFDCISAAAKKAASYGGSIDDKIFVFCEDKLTLSTESALVGETGGTFNAEVCSFGRFASKRYGKTSDLSKEGAAMVVKKILAAKRSELKAFARIEASPTLAAELSELIAQLKSAKITPEALLACEGDCPENVAAKVHDVAVAFREYEDFLEKRGLTDSNNSLRHLPDLIRADRAIKDARAIIVGYSSVTRQSCDVVAALYETAKSTDFFCVDGENKNVYTGEFLDFATGLTKETPKRLKSDASDEALRLVSSVFDPEKISNTGLYSDKVYVYEATDPVDEAEFIAARIKSEVLGGARYKDIAVAVGDLAAYSLTIKRVMADYGIPYFSDEKKKLSDHPLTRLALSALRVAERGEIRYIKEVISNSIFLPDKKDSDKMLRALAEQAITAKYFLSEDSLIFADDLFLNAKHEAIRRFSRILNKKDKASRYADALAAFLDDSGAYENVAAAEKKLAAIGADEESAFCSAATGKFADVLDEIRSILGEEQTTLAEFGKLVSSGAEASEISLIPEYSDCVYVSELKNCRSKKYRVLFAAGLDGDIPAVKADTAILRDGDIGRLDDLSVRVEPKIRIVNAREREAVALALASFGDRLFASYSLKSASGKQLRRSEITDYIFAEFSDGKRRTAQFTRQSLKKAAKYADGGRKDALDAFDYMSVRPALFSFVKAGDDFRSGASDDFAAASSFYLAVSETDGGKYRALADGLIGNVNRRVKILCDVPPENYFADGDVSASVLETYYSCPYKNFLKYGVGLADSVTPDMRSLDFGNIAHSVAEIFVKRLDEVGNEEEAENLARSIFAEVYAEGDYGRFAKSPDYAYSLTLAEKEAVKLCKELYREFSHSLFRPIGEEVWFADWSEYKALPLRTKKPGYKLFGKADRLDKYGDYVRIIDYKTGNAAEKVKDEKFYVGINLQLYLYMNAFAVGGDKPAGAYYYAVNDDFAKEGEKNFRMHGKTLYSEEIIAATDDGIYDGKPSSSVNVTVKEKGGVKKATGNLADERTLGGYVRYARLMAEAGVDDITAGVIAATPYGETCKYCEYNALCGYDEETDDRTRKASGVKPETIVEAAEVEDARKR